jgi:hypothetical protein
MFLGLSLKSNGKMPFSGYDRQDREDARPQFKEEERK